MELFKKADKIYPKHVSGRFRNLKWMMIIILFAIYYGAPWLRWDRGPHVPNQAILIDMVGQRGYFFGIEIWPQEVYLLVGLLILGAIGLFFATALLGRAWCGYACPQTVWTDLFVMVERLIQGDRNARIKLKNAKWSLSKLVKLGLTHSIWLLIGASTGGAWVLYFNDAPTLFYEIMRASVPSSVMVWFISLTLSTYFMAGFARENVCTYVCPYARFQSAMFDRDSLIITYDKTRGEPRGKHKKDEPWEDRGHCIDCDSCVHVCPMGIDIRDGLQMQCISCGLCIDACDHVMDKLSLPRGLVRYDTEAKLENPDKSLKYRFLRPRTIAYSLILAIVGTALLLAIIGRPPTELTIIHNRSPLFVRQSDGHLVNAYRIKILNKTHQDRIYRLRTSGIEPLKTTILAAGDREVSFLEVPANSVGEFRVRLKAAQMGQNHQDFLFILNDTQSKKEASRETYFVRKTRR